MSPRSHFGSSDERVVFELECDIAAESLIMMSDFCLSNLMRVLLLILRAGGRNLYIRSVRSCQ